MRVFVLPNLGEHLPINTHTGLPQPHLLPRAPPATMALVRLYYIDPQGKAAYITCDNDQVLTDDEYLFQWQLTFDLPRGSTMALVAGNALVPTRSGRAWHACYVDLGGDFMLSVRQCMQTAVKYTPDNAAYGLVFLNAASWEPAQYKTAKAIVQDRLKEAGCLSDPAPVPPPVDPLMEWYTLNKEAKAAEEALLAKMREALIEKAKDPALNPTNPGFDYPTGRLLEVLSASTENITFLGTPARFAAYEACGLRFGPVLATPELHLLSLDRVTTPPRHVRMTDLPWVTKEQD
jgi:hypothetical protein